MVRFEALLWVKFRVKGNVRLVSSTIARLTVGNGCNKGYIQNSIRDMTRYKLVYSQNSIRDMIRYKLVYSPG